MLSVFDWIAVKLDLAFAHPAVAAAILSVLLGVTVAECMVRTFPADYSTYRAQRLLRLIAGGFALCAGFQMQPTGQGFLVALICGLAAPTVHDLALGWLFARWPNLKPPVLKTELDKCSG